MQHTSITDPCRDASKSKNTYYFNVVQIQPRINFQLEHNTEKIKPTCISHTPRNGTVLCQRHHTTWANVMANIMSTPKGQQCAWHSTRSTIILSCTWVGLGDGTCKRCKSKQSQRQPHIACIQLQQGPCKCDCFFGTDHLTKYRLSSQYLVLHFRHSTSSTFFLSKLWVGSASSWQNLRVQNFPFLDFLSLFSHLFLKTFSLPHSLSSFLHFFHVQLVANCLADFLKHLQL